MKKTQVTIEFPIFVNEVYDYHVVDDYAKLLSMITGKEHFVFHFGCNERGKYDGVIFLDSKQKVDYLCDPEFRSLKF